MPPFHTDPHDLAAQRRRAEHERREHLDGLMRQADSMWTRVQLDANARLMRSTRRLQARLERRQQHLLAS